MSDHASPAVSGTVQADVLCRASLWALLQDWLDSLAADGDRHDMVMGDGGLCYDDCPACTAAKLAKAMREEAQNVCVSDGPADAPELTRSAEGPFAARNG